MKIYSTGPGIPVLLKLEGGAPTYEVLANTTKTNEWEVLIFDFSAANPNANDFLLYRKCQYYLCCQ